MQQSKLTKSVIAITGITIIAISFIGYLFVSKPLLRLKLAQNPLVQFLLPTYRSFRKIVDIPYLPYQFTKDDLPVYDITIDIADIARMNAALPDDLLRGRLTDEDKLKVRAGFAANGYEDRIDIRYRGWAPNHWNAYKKSFHVEFDTNNPFHGVTELKLIIPEDRQYAIEPLNDYRAAKLGMFAPQPWFVRVRLNGNDLGVYHAIPHWNAALADRNGFGEFANIFGTIDLMLDKLAGKNFFDPAEISFWKDYTYNAETLNGKPDDVARLQEFLTFVHQAPDDVYKRALPIYVDMDTLYSWIMVNTLGGSTHQNTTGNITLLQNPATGRFQPVPWDVQIYPAGAINLASHPLVGRTLAVPEFRQEFLRRLKAYVTNSANLADDLRFFDELVAAIKPALYKDTAKLPLNFFVGRAIAENRRMVEKNFNFIRGIFETGAEESLFEDVYTTYDPQNKGVLSPFAAAATMDTAQFLAAHKQFYRKGKNEIGIGPGTVILRNTVILPVDGHLVIAPDTTILMGTGASLVSFQPLSAEGTGRQPITIRAYTSAAWGSFLVLGNRTSKSTIFEYVRMSGGSGFNAYGILATGMLAIHNGNAEIRESVFEHTFDDDAVNVKWGSVLIENNIFRDTYGDAIDLDSTRGTVRNNTFHTIGREAIKKRIINGDAIDVSFSTVTITENTVDTCGDKGISVGELSYPFIINNTIKNCAIGISVKDLSEASIENTRLINNGIGIEVKQKKQLFGGGRARVRNVIFENNEQDMFVDTVSALNRL